MAKKEEQKPSRKDGDYLIRAESFVFGRGDK